MVSEDSRTIPLCSELETSLAAELARFEGPAVVEAVFESDPERQALLALAANSAFAARRLYTDWAFTERNGQARELFAHAADTTQKQYEQILWLLPDTYSPRKGGILYEELGKREHTIERVASGIVARSLITTRAFDGIGAVLDSKQCDELFDDIASELRSLAERGDTLLDDLCEDDGDRERARSAARRTIEVAASDLSPSAE